MRHILKKLILLLVMSFLVTACVPKVKTVLVTNYPTEYLMNELAGNRVKVVRLDNGTVPQTAKISNQYEMLIKEADVIFYINELQPYWELYKDEINNAKIQMIDLAERSSLYNFSRYSSVTVNQQKVTLELPYYEGISNETTDLYNKDPFLWMDPLAMNSIARTMLDWLVASYPDNKEAFQENFDRLEIDLVRLQADFLKLNDNENTIKFATMTPSFGNWQKSYGIEIFPIIMSKYGALPSEKELNEIREVLESEGVRTIVKEDNLSETQLELFKQVKAELDLEEIELSNLYTLSLKDLESNSTYITKMYQNLQTLETHFK